MLEIKLKESGLTPVMSDRPTSEFTNPGEANSIEVCLQNLRQCERVILVLSQRYGPSLQKAGFEDVSATHLEYKEARKGNIPVLFYVRDRLHADYEQHRKNPEAKPLWAKENDSAALYGMIKQHRELANTEQNNWFWTFSSAVDLCDRVLKDLGTVSSNAKLRELDHSRSVPTLVMDVAQHGRNIKNLRVSNVGECVADRIVVSGPDGKPLGEPFSLKPGDSRSMEYRFDRLSEAQLLGNHPAGCFAFFVQYSALSGDRIRETFASVLDSDGKLHFVPAGREVVGRSLRFGSPVISVHGAWSFVPHAVMYRAWKDQNY